MVVVLVVSLAVSKVARMVDLKEKCLVDLMVDWTVPLSVG